MKNAFFGSQEELLQKLHHGSSARMTVSPQRLYQPQPSEGKEEAVGLREQDLRGLPSPQNLSLASQQSWLLFVI